MLRAFGNCTKVISQGLVRCLIANYFTRLRCNFKGLSQDGGGADFSENLLASLFNDDLLNEPNFSRIHITGQYNFNCFLTKLLHCRRK